MKMCDWCGKNEVSDGEFYCAWCFRGLDALAEKEGNAHKIDVPKDKDPINHPPHYKFGDYEVIDVIMAWITDNDVSGADGFLWASMQQYLFRYRKKRGVQDLKKARWYLDKLVEKYDGTKEAG